MKKQYIIVIIIIVVVLGLGVSFFFWRDNGVDFDANNVPSLPDRSGIGSGEQGPGTGFAATFPMAEISTHNSADSCWTVIGTTVYDVTTWINQHPGGKSAILGLCGKDGTAAFEGKHGGDAKPKEQLAKFFIGTLRSAQPDGVVN